MITFDTNKARFLSNLRICDAIPGIATVTNIAHLIFKVAPFFMGPQVEPSLYSKFVSQASALEFIIRAIPVVGQIFNAAQHLYYERKILKEVACPPLHVMTSELGHTYIHAAIKNKKMGDFVKKSLDFLTPKKFEMIVDVLIKNNQLEELYYLGKKCDLSLITDDIRTKVVTQTNMKTWYFERKKAKMEKQKEEYRKELCEYMKASDPLFYSYEEMGISSNRLDEHWLVDL